MRPTIDGELHRKVIKACLDNDWKLATRTLAIRFGVSHASIVRIIRNYKNGIQHTAQ